MARATKRLSARTVETITNPGYHADGDGLYLKVDGSGARRWAFIFYAQGKRREMGLGRMGLKEAREKGCAVSRKVGTQHVLDDAPFDPNVEEYQIIAPIAGG